MSHVEVLRPFLSVRSLRYPSNNAQEVTQRAVSGVSPPGAGAGGGGVGSGVRGGRGRESLWSAFQKPVLDEHVLAGIVLEIGQCLCPL